MRLYYGKELRSAIYNAAKTVCGYLNSEFDVKPLLWTEYKARVGTSTDRTNTVYGITDELYEDYSSVFTISNALCGGYLGDTEFVCGLMDNKLLFVKEDPEPPGPPEPFTPDVTWTDQTKIGVVEVNDNNEPIGDIVYFDTHEQARDYIGVYENYKRYFVHEGDEMNPAPTLSRWLYSGYPGLKYMHLHGHTSIPDGCFDGSDGCSLAAITGLDGITEIGDNAFYGAPMEAIALPNTLETIGYSAFSGSLLTEIVIPDSVTSMLDHCFSYCYQLQSVILSNSLTEICLNSFWNCASLESINIPEGVVTIGGSAFNNCLSLINVTLPNTVTTLGEYAFEDCESLESIVIPSSMTSIDSNAFYGCEALRTITVNKSSGSISGAPWGAENADVIWTG